MKILIASFECNPYAKVGGLADVIGTLPQYIKNKKIDIRIVIPLFKKIDIKKYKLKKLEEKVCIPLMGEYIEGYIWQGKLKTNVPIYFVQNDKFYGRDEIYGTQEGDYPDNAFRFIFFCRSVLELAKAIDFKPDIIHCHDAQTGLIPAYLKTLYKIDAFFNHTKTIFTIHNIAYQCIYPKEIHFAAGFSEYDFVPEKFEYYGKINFMKCGIVFSDIVTTVSETYAKMISSSNEGRGLEGVLAKRFLEKNLVGIINGVDYTEWNPETDPYIKANYNLENISLKKLCKEDLQQICNFEIKDVPLYGMVSRIDSLKGFDILISVLSKILKTENIQIVILGKGNKLIQNELINIQKVFPSKLNVVIDFNNELAHKIYAGSDFFLMPSHSEPCGIAQMIAAKYGTIPIVNKTGGLADTVVPYFSSGGFGFVLEHNTPEGLYNTILETIKVFCDKQKMNQIITNAMKKDFSWERSAEKYIEIFNKLIKTDK